MLKALANHPNANRLGGLTKLNPCSAKPPPHRMRKVAKPDEVNREILQPREPKRQPSSISHERHTIKRVWAQTDEF